MKHWKRKMAAAALAAVCATGAFAAPLEVEAASVTEKILYGTAAMLFVSNYYSRMDDHNQLQLLVNARRKRASMRIRRQMHVCRMSIRESATRERSRGIIRSTYPLRKTSMRS